MISNETALMAHLLRRAGFGASRDELEQYMAMGYDGAVEDLLLVLLRAPRGMGSDDESSLLVNRREELLVRHRIRQVLAVADPQDVAPAGRALLLADDDQHLAVKALVQGLGPRVVIGQQQDVDPGLDRLYRS